MIFFFLIFAQNIDWGYMLEPPCRGGSNEYFGAKIRKIGIHHFCIIRWFPALKKINIGNTGNQNPPDLKGQGGSGYLFFQY